MAIFGIITLAAGYALAIFTKDAVDAVLLFFIAVILVIIGTYFLFTAGSIALLKVLKKNKKYYYKPNHFISVSGMTYRMKQNSVGLASICILATMLLVTISATTSFMFGRNDMIAQKIPIRFNCSSKRKRKCQQHINGGYPFGNRKKRYDDRTRNTIQLFTFGGIFRR